MKLVIGNDHAATELKFQIMAYLEQKGVEVINVGTDTNESFDYAIAAFKAGKLVASGEADGGVLQPTKSGVSGPRPAQIRLQPD